MKEKIKVLRNFSCNGVKKKVGDILTEDDKDKIGKKFGRELFDQGFFHVLGKEDSKEEEEKEKKRLEEEAELKRLEEEEEAELKKLQEEEKKKNSSNEEK
jgi:vacuolar-type H+-ATPase subunit I/STV1